MFGDLTFADLTISQNGHRAIVSITATGEKLAALNQVNSCHLTKEVFIDRFDNTAPQIEASLARDTGASAIDGITSNPTITGQVSDRHKIVGLKAGFDGTKDDALVDVTDILHPDGSFTLNETKLKQINCGHPLKDGSYTLNLIATDESGNESAIFPVSFVLDRTLPELEVTAPAKNAIVTAESQVMGTVEDDVVFVSYRFNEEFDTEVPIHVNDDGSFSQKIDLTGRKPGTEQIVVLAMDTAGNLTLKRIEVKICSDNADTTAPIIEGNLANDTGMDDADGITFDPAISGKVNDDNKVVSLKAGLNTDNIAHFRDITDLLHPDGRFNLSADRLKHLNNGHPLADGDYTLNLIATDEAGNESHLFPIAFALDTTAPGIHISEPANKGKIDPESQLIGAVDEDMVMLTYRFNDGAEIDVDLSDRHFEQTFDLTDLTQGRNHLTLPASDKAGNVNSHT